MKEYTEKLKNLMALKDVFDEFQMSASLLIMESVQNNLLRDLEFIVSEVSMDTGMRLDKSSRLSQQYGCVDDYARDLFKTMTGKNFPADVKLDISKIEEEGVRGFADYLNKVVKSEDGHYARVLCTMMHEMGHFISQHDESAHTSLKKVPREVNMLEEACAYCFQTASAYALSEKDPFLAKAAQLDMFLYFKDFIKEYFEGEQEHHREAVAVADAAITVFGNPKAAYNYLATANPFNLDPRIRETIEKNREIYMQVKRQDLQKLGDEKLSELSEINNRFLELIETVHPNGKEMFEDEKKAEQAAKEAAKKEIESRDK